MKHAGLNVTLDDLPMLASDRQIAEAIVSKEIAEKWLRQRLPTLAGARSAGVRDYGRRRCRCLYRRRGQGCRALRKENDGTGL
ncbi:hypothetical protein MesoLjLb_21020 [Mesorhizobium sp. L-8-3]|nr:hypothetical protein MesoLjLb_21020 [Mesorhizobium sp. L-8-3]